MILQAISLELKDKVWIRFRMDSPAARIRRQTNITRSKARSGGCQPASNDDHSCLAMLRNRCDEIPHEMLFRLDAAIGKTRNEGDFTD